MCDTKSRHTGMNHSARILSSKLRKAFVHVRHAADNVSVLGRTYVARIGNSHELKQSRDGATMV